MQSAEFANNWWSEKRLTTIVLSLFSKHPLQSVPGYVAALFCRQGANKKTFQTKTGRDWPLAAFSQLLTFPSLQALPFKTAPALWGWQGRVSRVVVMTESSAELNFPEKSTLQKTGAKMRKKRQDNDMGGQHYVAPPMHLGPSMISFDQSKSYVLICLWVLFKSNNL